MKKAQPIWLMGKSEEMNYHGVFSVEVPSGKALSLHLASTAFFRVYLNGKFLAFGPARTAKGYLREDILPLPQEGGKLLIEACGYYCKSLSTVKQPSLILAEICQGEEPILWSGRDFLAFNAGCRRQKVERYSIQRHFTEVWDFDQHPSLLENPWEIEILQKEMKLLPRRVPKALYEEISFDSAKWQGHYSSDESRKYRNYRYSWKEIPISWGVFSEEEIPSHPFRWVWKQAQKIEKRAPQLPLSLEEGSFALFDFEKIEAGFLKIAYESLKDTQLILAFCETMEGENFTYDSLSGHHVVEINTAKGDQREFMTFEPYTFRYCMVMVKKGQISLKEFGCKTYMYDISRVGLPEKAKGKLGEICQAAIRTFAHNAVDLYTDCPSRERAGWLCDSYFTARAEYAITGKTLIEDAFLENYRLFENDGSFLKGTLPDCYPSDVQPAEPFIPMGIFPKEGPKPGEVVFIPQWTMWYILEVEEYIFLRGHEEMKEAFRSSIYGLLDFYRRYKNEDGLLEDLPSWNFVEWSRANEWVRNVNYPTNFLYAGVLDAIDHIYGDESCKREAEAVRKKVIEQSFNGTYFLDHSIREGGKLSLQQDASEACQYYAVLFGGIDMDSKEYQPLKKLILEVFSPSRGADCMPEIFPVNAFIGAYLRMDVLLKMGSYEQLLSDVEGFFGHMSEKTGTLWEYREQEKGSHDHGFAAYVYAAVQAALN